MKTHWLRLYRGVLARASHQGINEAIDLGLGNIILEIFHERMYKVYILSIRNALKQIYEFSCRTGI